MHLKVVHWDLRDLTRLLVTNAASPSVILHVSPAPPAPPEGGPCCERVWAPRPPPLVPASPFAVWCLWVLAQGPWQFIQCAREPAHLCARRKKSELNTASQWE